MLEHLWHCAALFAADPIKMPIAAFSLIAACAAFLLLTRGTISFRTRIIAVYAHLSLIVFPIIFFALTMHCGPHCNTPLINMILYSLPLSIGIASFIGFVAAPLLLLSASSEMKAGFAAAFVKKQSKIMGIKPPKIYLARTYRAAAFSFRSVSSAIFVSEKLLKTLNKKETEAVLLHELAHVSMKSSVFKISAFLMRFSPLSVFRPFGSFVSDEEKKADEFAIRAQKTDKHLLSAKMKIERGIYKSKNQKNVEKLLSHKSFTRIN